jgi:hypothetical protein
MIGNWQCHCPEPPPAGDLASRFRELNGNLRLGPGGRRAPRRRARPPAGQGTSCQARGLLVASRPLASLQRSHGASGRHCQSLGAGPAPTLSRHARRHDTRLKCGHSSPSRHLLTLKCAGVGLLCSTRAAARRRRGGRPSGSHLDYRHIYVFLCYSLKLRQRLAQHGL